jgi:hypothetical protein
VRFRRGRQPPRKSARTYALAGGAVALEILKPVWEFGDDIIGQIGVYLGGSQ